MKLKLCGLDAHEVASMLNSSQWSLRATDVHLVSGLVDMKLFKLFFQDLSSIINMIPTVIEIENITYQTYNSKFVI